MAVFKEMSMMMMATLMIVILSDGKSQRPAGLFDLKLAESAFFRDLASELGVNTEDEPLSEYLWQSTQTEQQEALNSNFIQGMKNGTLDPSIFGEYMVQDSVYCYYSKNAIDTAAKKATDPVLQDFLEKKSESYKKYYQELFKAWHIRDPNGIALNDACTEYIALLNDVAENMSSLYFVVALIPCAKLWPWLGKQISDSQHNFGVYERWVDDNLNPSYDGYMVLDTIIDDAFVVGDIDRMQALSVYERCMMAEANFFNSVSSFS